MATSSRNAPKPKIWELDVRPLDWHADNENAPSSNTGKPKKDLGVADCSCSTAYTPGIINCVRGADTRRIVAKRSRQ